MTLFFKRFFLFLSTILALESAASAADRALPYSVRTKPYSAFSSTVRGDPRTVGMAGATVGLADTFVAAGDNPAGLAMTLNLGDTHASTNRIFDGHLQDRNSSIQVSNIGAALSLGKFGLSLGLNNIWNEGQSYLLGSNPQPQWVESYVQEYRLSGAYRLHSRLSLGIQLRMANLTQALGDSSNPSAAPTTEDTALGYGLGLLYRLPHERLLLGLSYFSGISLDASNSSLPYTFSQLPGFAQKVRIPSRISLGVGYTPNRLLRGDLSLKFACSTPGAALLSDQGREVGNQSTLQPHLGMAYLFADFAPIQGTLFFGNYLEASRVQGFPSRLHTTIGAEAKWSFVNFGIGYDTAVSYQNYIASIGIDPFSILEVMDVIPRPSPLHRRGFFPNPWYSSDEGLTSSLQNADHRQNSRTIDPFEVGKKIPEKLEKKVRQISPESVIKTIKKLPKNIRKDIQDVTDTIDQQN